MKKRSVIYLVAICFFTLVFVACKGQTKKKDNQLNDPQVQGKIVGGGCDGCEIMYVGMPADIKPVDTSSGWSEKGQKLLLTGTVYQKDGNTPAPGVIIYYWQTDNTGHYSPREGMDVKANRHGHIRGWVKTGEKGKYSIYTIRPVPYPNADIPAHIHTAIKEPKIKNEYYIDEFVFDEDPILTDAKRKGFENRGGSGILKIRESGNLQIAEHDIILGLNIPDYPKD